MDLTTASRLGIFMQGRRVWRSRAPLTALLLATSVSWAGPFSDIYVLGDSLSDQGNLFKATQALTGSGLPASDHYFSGRFSNGEVYSGLLAQALGLTLTASSTGGNNFAYGGTRTNYNIVEDPPTPGGATPGLYPWTLNLQRQAFADRHVADPNALYVVFSGSNDVGDLIRPTLIGGFGATLAQSNAAAQAILDVVITFKNTGAQYVLVPNVPDLGVVPSITRLNPPGSNAISDVATALSQRFNNTVDSLLAEFTGIQIVRFDTFDFVRQVRNDPALFNLTNVTQPCYTGFVDPAGPSDTVCANPQSYAYWDVEHPTTVMHSLLADHMSAALNVAVVPEPASWALMLVGLSTAGFLAGRRKAN